MESPQNIIKPCDKTLICVLTNSDHNFVKMQTVLQN